MAVAHVTEYMRVWVDALNRRDLSVAEQTFARDCVIHVTGFAEPVRGLETWKQVVGGFLAAFPDLTFTIEEQLTAGETVVTRWSARGTQTGAFGPVPPTGRAISIDGLIVDHLVGGKVRERW